MRPGDLLLILPLALLSACSTRIPHGEAADGMGEGVSSWRDVRLLPPSHGKPDCPHEILESVRVPATGPGFVHLDELRQRAWSMGGQAVIYAVWDETGAEGTAIRFRNPKCRY
jgi:hypothetical protein